MNFQRFGKQSLTSHPSLQSAIISLDSNLIWFNLKKWPPLPSSENLLKFIRFGRRWLALPLPYLGIFAESCDAKVCAKQLELEMPTPDVPVAPIFTQIPSPRQQSIWAKKTSTKIHKYPHRNSSQSGQKYTNTQIHLYTNTLIHIYLHHNSSQSKISCSVKSEFNIKR